jgi:hypothetical protein
MVRFDHSHQWSSSNPSCFRNHQFHQLHKFHCPFQQLGHNVVQVPKTQNRTLQRYYTLRNLQN